MFVHPARILHTKASIFTEAFTHSKRLHREAFTHNRLSHTASIYTQQAFAQRSFYTARLLHTASICTAKLLHTASIYTQQALTHSKHLHTASIYTQQAFTHSKHLHTAGFHTQQAFTQRSFYKQKLSHTGSFTLSSQGLIHGTCCGEYSFGIRSTTWSAHQDPFGPPLEGRRACRRQLNNNNNNNNNNNHHHHNSNKYINICIKPAWFMIWMIRSFRVRYPWWTPAIQLSSEALTIYPESCCQTSYDNTFPIACSYPDHIQRSSGNVSQGEWKVRQFVRTSCPQSSKIRAPLHPNSWRELDYRPKSHVLSTLW